MTTSSRRTTPFVGQTAQLSRTVGDKDIALFTEISGDRNPLHDDEAAAKASRFGEIVVQGAITSAILNALVAEELPGPGTVFPECQLGIQGTGVLRRHHHGPRRSHIGAHRKNRSLNCGRPSPVTTEPSSWTEQRRAT